MPRLLYPISVVIIIANLFIITSCIAAIDVSGPLVITKPGTYELSSDIYLKNNSVFFDIRSSDVILDGKSHTIDHLTSPLTSSQTSGVKIAGINRELQNVSVMNIKVNNFSKGISAEKLKRGYINKILLFGNTKGISILNSSSVTITMSDIIGSVGKSQSLTEGIYLENVKDALITDNLLEKQSSGGIELKNSKNITMGGNWIDINNGAGISLDKTTQGLIVNNYLNNTMNTRILGDSNATWNFEKRNGPNIMNGPYAGGNYWASPDGKGFSQQCNGRGDGFCNESYILNAQNKDNLPLTLIYIKPLPDQALPPTDPDKDGLYKDINGNGKKDYEDIVLDFQYLDWIRDNEPLNYFDFDRNGKIDYEDVVTLFSDIG